ncbi:MAG: hypothetical protein HKL83_08850 [Acidimicrobiaceae bacterium]|nr:hypothetical protein [Acidimicrobiaceae bacterium]
MNQIVSSTPQLVPLVVEGCGISVVKSASVQNAKPLRHSPKVHTAELW